MNSCYTLLLLALTSCIQAQIVHPFEFFDQDSRNSIVTDFTTLDGDIYYTAYSGFYDDGGARINVIKKDAPFKSISIGDYTYEKSEFILGSDGNLYAVFYELFDCDFSPASLYIYNCTEEELAFEIQDYKPYFSVAITTSADEIAFHTLRKNHLDSKYYLETFTRNLITGEMSYDPVHQEEIEGVPYKLLERNNKVIFLEGNKLYDLATRNVLVEFESPCLKVDEKEDHIICFNKKIDWYNKRFNRIDSTKNIDIAQLVNINGEEFPNNITVYKEGILFINRALNDKVIVYAKNQTTFIPMFTESVSELGLQHVIADDEDFTYSLLLNNQQTVIRQTKELIPYDFERVDLCLSDPRFETSVVDTHVIQQNGEPFYFQKKYVKSSVTVTNKGDQSIENFTLHSHARSIQPFDCGGFYYISTRVNQTIEEAEEFRFRGRFRHFMEDFPIPYFQAYGANYKLDKNLSDNYVEGFATPSSVKNEQIDVLLSPNPFVGYFDIHSELIKEVDIEVYDIQGNIHLKSKKSNTNERINLSHVTPGVYFVQLSNARSKSTYKMIKL